MGGTCSAKAGVIQGGRGASLARPIGQETWRAARPRTGFDWEIATLVQLGRIRLKMPLREWLDNALEPPWVELHAISPAVAAEVAALPEHFPRDPGDRIIVATARVLGARLLTLDEVIIDSGVVEVVT
jgi:PIN domain nuclease of toxin-antitoxin system